MLQTTRLPVKVYQSTDKDAPQMTDTAGSLKTVLKACLVTGYGDKPSLGWETLFENATDAIFKRTDPKATEFALLVQNTNKDYATISMVEKPTSLTQWFKQYGYQSNQNYYPYNKQRGSSWVLVGHGLAFVLITDGYYFSNGGFNSRMLWFGDFPSLLEGDMNNCLMWMPSQRTTLSAGHSGFFARDNTSSAANPAIMTSSYDGLAQNAQGLVHSLCEYNSGLPYPDPVMGGFVVSETWLLERIGNSSPMTTYLRGLWPGLFFCSNQVPLAVKTQVTGIDGSDDTFMCFTAADTGQYQQNMLFINITAWEA